MNRQELLRAAKREVEKRRQRAESRAALRREEIEKAVPQLAQLAQQKAEIGAQAAKLALDGQKQAAEEKLQELSLLAQRRRVLLGQHGFSEEEFLPQYTCGRCSDIGYIKGALCGCVKEVQKKLRREEIHKSGPLTLCRFENFDINLYPEEMEGSPLSPRRSMQNILADCREYAMDFGKRSPSLLMFGDAGLGKTHLALSIAAEVLEKGYDVIYVSAQSAFAQVSDQRFNNKGSEVFTSMLEADLLVLDDLGTEYLDAYLLSKLYELINARMQKKPTIYTTNICDDRLLYQRYTEKIASRLLGGCSPMRFWGYDLRLCRQNL